MPAKYDLGRIKMLVNEWLGGVSERIWFSPRKKSFGAISSVLKEDDAIAQETAAKGIARLTPDCFYEQTYLSGRSVVADVYGLESFRGHNWYVKFYLASEQGDEYVGAISFHPLDDSMTRENGSVLVVTYKGVRPWKD